MYNTTKRIRLYAAVLALLLSIGCIGVSLSLSQSGKWVPAYGTMVPIIERAILVDSCGIDAPCSVQATDNIVQIHLGTMTMPGAWAAIEVTVKNAGNLAANLSQIVKTNCTSDYIKVSFPDIDTESEPPLKENESCTFTMVVSWDESCSCSTVMNEADTFALVLTYVNDELQFIPDASSDNGFKPSSALTGDTKTPLLWFLLMVIGALGSLFCLCRLRRKG